MLKRIIVSLILLINTYPILAQIPNNSSPLSLLDLYHTASPIRSPYLNPHVLKLALKAYHCAKEAGLVHKDLLTIVDYTLPSTIKRLWIIDMDHNRVLYNTLVSHGKKSGINYPHFFSDKPHSYASSIGLFITANKYHGHYGAALRLKGLEAGFNSNAFSRDIVIHSAWYVSQRFAKAHGYIGRSWGCFALNTDIGEPIIDLIKDGTLLFSYYPDNKWLSNSLFLHCS